MANVINFKKICRICADNNSKTLAPLFKVGTQLLIRFIHIREFNIKMAKNDGLPQTICSECLKQLSTFDDFLAKCKKSEQILSKKFNQTINIKKTNDTKKGNDVEIQYNSDNDTIKKEHYSSDDEITYNNINTSNLVIQKFNLTNLNMRIKIEANSEIDAGKSVLRIDECQNQIVEKIYENQESDKYNDRSYYKNSNLSKRKTNFKIKKFKNQNESCKKLECSFCNEKFEFISELKLHKKLHQEIKKSTRFLCDLCGKEFAKQESLKEHMNTHLGIRPYKCQTCEKTYSLKNAFRTHVLKHSKHETYTCNICAKTYTTKSYYHEHFKRHEKGILLKNNEKPFKCPHCPKTFKLLSTLTAHCNYHNKTSDRKYHCSECNTTFKRSDHLKEHINGVHLNIKPYKCETCSKSFVTGAIRNAHVKKFHSGIRYKCNLCDKDFSLSASLSRHKRHHNGDKRFICEICNMSFMAVYQIEKHMETHKIDESTKNKIISQTYEEIAKAVINTNK